MVDKNMLIGALVTSVTQAALEGYYNYMAGLGKAPSGQFPYISLGTDYLPSGDTWLSCAGVPLILYAVGKTMRKDAAIGMAKGGAIYGASTLIGITTYRVALKAQGLSATYVVRR